MHTLDVDYTDLFTNEKRQKRMYFHITAFEFAELAADFGSPAEFAEFFQKAFSDKATYSEGFKGIKMLFVTGYGRRKKNDSSEQGDIFVKNPQWLQELIPSPEFEAVFLKMTTDAKFAASFWNGLVSEELIAAAQKIQDANAVAPTPEGKKKFRDMTLEEQVAALQARAASKGVSLDDE